MARPSSQRNTREMLLETAIDLIWKSSYPNVGVNEICQAAGVTKGGFYHHFDSKAELFFEASMHHWEQKKAEMDHLYSPEFTPLEQLENMIAHIIDWQERDQGDQNPVCGCPFFTAGAQVGSGEELVREAGRVVSDHAARYHAALIRGLKGGGYLNGDCEPEQVSRLLVQYIQGLLLYGRVYYDLDVVRRDMRAGLYRIVDLKPEYRVAAADAPELKTLAAKAPAGSVPGKDAAAA
ncbi:MAG: TetR/AcrR family transcriptional regulator [Alphaproteobacteria bacterium]|nr:MAG: TetR/AcrR family transcriptional regulator [Alphaproteobacteria bacterium]